MIAAFLNEHIKKRVAEGLDQNDDLKQWVIEQNSKEDGGALAELISPGNVDMSLTTLGSIPANDTTEAGNQRVVDTVKKKIGELQNTEMQGLKKYNIPVILVMTADTLNVVEINRQLVKYYHSTGDQW